MMKKQPDNTPKSLEQQLSEKAAQGYTVCYSEKCPLRQHCLHWMASSYANPAAFVVKSVNLSNTQMQTDDCPMYRSDQPVRMPLGISSMYYDMPGHLERSLKHHLITYFNHKRYYYYHSGYQPVPPEHEQYIRQAAAAFGWHQPIEFKNYVEEYLW